MDKLIESLFDCDDFENALDFLDNKFSEINGNRSLIDFNLANGLSSGSSLTLTKLDLT
jgi:hypothetical protein